MLKLNLSLKELRLIAKSRGIKGYKNISKEKLKRVLLMNQNQQGMEKFLIMLE